MDKKKLEEMNASCTDRTETEQELQTAFTEHIMLSGTVIGTREDRVSGALFARVRYKDKMVSIPASELSLYALTLRDSERSNFERGLARRCAGADVDFYVTYVDDDTGEVFGSRAAALKTNIYRYYLGIGATGGYVEEKDRVRPGLTIDGKVLVVNAKSLVLEIRGADVLIPARELMYIRHPTIYEFFQPGQGLNAVITNVICDTSPEHVMVVASVKAATPNPKRYKIRDYTPGDMVSGRVLKVGARMVFALVDKDVDVACPIPVGVEPLAVGDAIVLRISEVNESQLRIYGDILKRDNAFIRL